MTNRLNLSLNPRCLSEIVLQKIIKTKLGIVWSWNESQKSRIKNEVCFLSVLWAVCSHVRHWWKTSSKSRSLYLPGARILWWNLPLDACLFDWASFTLWYVDSTAGYCILLIVCVCFCIPLSHFCLFILMSINGQNFPSFQSSSVYSFLFDFVLSLLYLLSSLGALPQTWHMQKKRGLLNHFGELKTKKEDQRCSPPWIYLNWCYTLLFSKV